MQPLRSRFAHFPPLRPPDSYSRGCATSQSCSLVREKVEKSSRDRFPGALNPGIGKETSKGHLKKENESRGPLLAIGLCPRRPFLDVFPLSFLLETCAGRGVCIAPRALARRIARSALGRLAATPNLAAIVFLLVSRSRASFFLCAGRSLARSKNQISLSSDCTSPHQHRTAPTSPSSCSTRATSCTASRAARRRTTTPGSSTSWTRVSFCFFSLEAPGERE